MTKTDFSQGARLTWRARPWSRYGTNGELGVRKRRAEETRLGSSNSFPNDLTFISRTTRTRAGSSRMSGRTVRCCRVETRPSWRSGYWGGAPPRDKGRGQGHSADNTPVKSAAEDPQCIHHVLGRPYIANRVSGIRQRILHSDDKARDDRDVRGEAEQGSVDAIQALPDAAPERHEHGGSDHGKKIKR